MAAAVAAGLLVAALAGNALRGGDAKLGRAELAAALEEVAAARPARAAPDPDPAPRLRAAAAEVAAGRLAVSRRDRCVPGEIVRWGAFDREGRLRVFVVRDHDGAEAHLYGEAGDQVAAAALRDGERAPAQSWPRAAAAAVVAEACGGGVAGAR